jgi:hypothetical protein
MRSRTHRAFVDTVEPQSAKPRADEPAPPDVYATPDSEPEPKPRPPVVVTVRVLHPLGTIPPEEHQEIGWWFLERHNSHTTDGMVKSGDFAIDGLIGLTARDVDAWKDCTLVIDLLGCESKSVERPPDPLAKEIKEITVSVASKWPLSTSSGRVRDDKGRPLAGAGVFLNDSRPREVIEPAVRTGADNTSRCSVLRTRAPSSSWGATPSIPTSSACRGRSTSATRSIRS